MSFVIVERTVIATHIIAALATGIDKLDFITAAHNLASKADPVMLISKRHYLSPPQPVPLNMIVGALNTLSIG
jgi:hypothetical protein